MNPAQSESAHQGVPIESSMLVIRLKDTGLTMETARSEGGKPTAFHETLNLRLDGLEMTSIGREEGPRTPAMAQMCSFGLRSK